MRDATGQLEAGHAEKAAWFCLVLQLQEVALSLGATTCTFPAVL